VTTRGNRRDEGQSLVEISLILPIVILLVVVVFDLGRAVYAHHTLGNAARGGLRVAIVDQTPAGIQEGARSRAVGLDPNTLIVTPIPCTTPSTIIGCEIGVQVSYPFEPITPLVGNIVGPMTLQSTSRAPVERVFPSPSP
jgi:Flp pilus assembly protein TadG